MSTQTQVPYLGEAELARLQVSADEALTAIESIIRERAANRAWMAPKASFTAPDGRFAMSTMAAAQSGIMVRRNRLSAAAVTLMLGEAAADGRDVALKDVADRGRDGITGARKRGDIGFTAIRGGDVVGEHDVIFAAAGERIVIRHLATDRMIFARGAIKAALWGKDQKPGEYAMTDVLGL